jgi:translocation and assembly module TamB
VWHGTATVDEIGAPLAASFSFDPQVGLGFDVSAKVPSLRGIPRLQLPVDGGGTVAVVGTLRDGALDARVKAHVDGLRAPGAVALATGGLDGRVHGPLAALEVDATVSGNGLRAGDYAWDKVLAHVRGPVLAPHVDAALDGGDTGSLSAAGKIDVKDKAVTGVDVELHRRDGTIRARVARVSAAPGGTKIEGLDLEGGGVGTLKGGLVVVGKEITGKLHGENVDLARVAAVAGLPLHVAGLANVDVDLTSSRQGLRTGHIALELVSGEALLLKGVSGLITATFEGDHVRADGLVRVVASPTPAEKALGVAAAIDVAAAFGVVVDEPCDGAVARLRFTKGDAELPGPLLDPATWRKLAGSVELAADEWNLRCIRRMVPFGLPDLRGRLTTRATVERAPGARLPSVRGFFAKTLGLSTATPA